MLLPQASPYTTYSQAIVRQNPQLPQIVPYQSYVTNPRPSIWDSYREMLRAPQEPTSSPLESLVTGLRYNGEGMALAGLLGLAHKHFGTLDVRGKYPVDGFLSAFLLALSIYESGKPNGYAGDLRALSQSASNVMVYRKMLGEPKAAETVKDSSIPRNTGKKDPVLEAAKELGF